MLGPCDDRGVPEVISQGRCPLIEWMSSGSPVLETYLGRVDVPADDKPAQRSCNLPLGRL